MIAEKAEPAALAASPSDKHHLTFFRQSGWLMIATTLGGLMMYAVHPIAKNMGTVEYGVFLTLIQIVSLMTTPAVGLQSVFAQQAAGVMTAAHERELAGVFRSVVRLTFFVWLVMAAGVFLFRDRVLSVLGISNPVALAVTVIIGLVGLWRPIVQGVLQGRQNFPWLGGLMITDGMGRLAAMFLIIAVLGNRAAGAMNAILVGMVFVLVVGVWLCRDCLRGDTTPVNWSAWLKRVVPLTFGMGVGIFMLAADMIFVQSFFSKKETGFYGAAGMIGRALVYFTTPVAAVMFPKLARSAATGEKSNALALALGFTALAGASAAIMCTLFPSLPIQMVYDKDYLAVSAPLVPWFAWCMLPLTLATVLLNSLMARSQFKAVPWMVAVAAGYGLTLYLRHESFIQVIQTIGIFGTLLLAVCAWFTFRPGASTKT